ncbi:Alpha-1,3-N-acetylgalactosamine transferase PglA [Lunatimonas lonarensis]|uniref:Alpha-1,3-N-acetylgalactosamine transferase PglA n=1 Tax=Lunatimonas lonarensis TaxID=1232681 RepID=R7ZSX6_9BACT|nr:glycosyltransferase family 4 protein [Lunatimonas lonarensis]EON77133.1 Alpha-1,3-N-acetylgalactosamine transferase PglA [Lunatimonas lonarensis]
MPKLIRITTVPLSLKLLLRGQMKFMRSAGWEVVMVSSEGKEWEQVQKQEGCNVEVIPFTRQVTPLQDLRCLWELYKLFKRERPDIVHSHTPKAGLLAMVAGFLAKVPIRIHTLAGLPFQVLTGNRRKIMIWMEKITFRFATEVWANAASLKDQIVLDGLVPGEKVRVIGHGSSNGVDLEVFDRYNLKENNLVAATMRIVPGENEFVILAVGRLVKDKGIEDLVEAFLVSKIVNKSKLVLLGSFEQDLNPLSRQTINRINDHPRIVHLEWTDHVACYMAIADILIHPSHREGFPNVLLEAGAICCPIICSDIPGNLEVVTHKKTGLVYPVRNVQALKEAMEFAYVKRLEMLAFAENLNREVTEKYDRKLFQQQLLQEYYRLWDKEINRNV